MPHVTKSYAHLNELEDSSNHCFCLASNQQTNRQDTVCLISQSISPKVGFHPSHTQTIPRLVWIQLETQHGTHLMKIIRLFTKMMAQRWSVSVFNYRFSLTLGAASRSFKWKHCRTNFGWARVGKFHSQKRKAIYIMHTRNPLCYLHGCVHSTNPLCFEYARAHLENWKKKNNSFLFPNDSSILVKFTYCEKCQAPLHQYHIDYQKSNWTSFSCTPSNLLFACNWACWLYRLYRCTW